MESQNIKVTGHKLKKSWRFQENRLNQNYIKETKSITNNKMEILGLKSIIIDIKKQILRCTLVQLKQN